MRRHKLIISILICFITGVYLYSATGTPSNLIVRTDANGSLVVTGATQVAPITQGVFTSRVLRTDSSGNLQVIIGSGPISPTSVSVPASTCAAPAINEQGATTTGIAFTATPSILMCVAGSAIETITGSSITSTVPYLGPSGSAAAPTFRATSEATGAYLSSAGVYGVSVAGSSRMLLSSTQFDLVGDNIVFRMGAASDISFSRVAAAVLGLNSSINITRGTITTDLPVRTDTVTWNSGGTTFTGWKLVVTDTASAAASLLMDLQVGAGTSKFKVDKNGTITNAGTINADTSSDIGWTGRSYWRSSANGLVSVVSNNGSFGLQFNEGATAAPTFNNGTVVTGSRNSAGSITLTGGNTGGTLTFSTNFTNAPFCTVTGTAATDVPQITSTSTSTLVVAGITANGTFYYICIGRI